MARSISPTSGAGSFATGAIETGGVCFVFTASIATVGVSADTGGEESGVITCGGLKSLPRASRGAIDSFDAMGAPDRVLLRLLFEILEQRDDLIVARIGVEHARIPLARLIVCAVGACDVAEVAQRNEIFGIERERGFERSFRLVVAAGLEQRLTVYDVPVHVLRLLCEMRLAERDRLVEIACFPIFIGERREKPARVFVVSLLELVDAIGGGHLKDGGRQTADGSWDGKRRNFSVIVVTVHAHHR